MTVTHSKWHCLTESTTVALLAGEKPAMEFDETREGRNAVSGVIVVPRRVWDAVDGFDEGFVGWGWEDIAFARACELAGGIERVDGPAWHLNHELPGVGNSAAVSMLSMNAKRSVEYEQASCLADLRSIRA
jgi:hypothetical protein